jgi:hypothetical protein
MSTVLVSGVDQRGPKAIALVANSGQWLKCRDRAGRKSYGIRSSASDNHYLVTTSSCTCRDFEYRSGPCKHMLAVRLKVDLERELRQERAR